MSDLLTRINVAVTVWSGATLTEEISSSWPLRFLIPRDRDSLHRLTLLRKRDVSWV